MPIPVNAHKTTTTKIKGLSNRKAVVRAAGTVPGGSGYGQTYPKGNKATG